MFFLAFAIADQKGTWVFHPPDTPLLEISLYEACAWAAFNWLKNNPKR